MEFKFIFLKFTFLFILFSLATSLLKRRKKSKVKFKNEEDITKSNIFKKFITNLEKELTKFDKTYPVNLNDYIKSSDIEKTSLVFDNFDLSKTLEKLELQKEILPEAALNKIKGIIYSQSVDLRSFTITVEELFGYLDNSWRN